MEVEKFPKLAYNFFKKTTPIQTGNARSRTRLQGNKIVAEYPYARPLDRGRSKQAPQGMTEPTGRYLEQQAKIRIKK